MIKDLIAEFTDVTQPCHADDAGSLGTFARVESYFNSQKRILQKRDKNGRLLGFGRHSYSFLFESFTSICSLLRNMLLF